jgi:hypothetical protein
MVTTMKLSLGVLFFAFGLLVVHTTRAGEPADAIVIITTERGTGTGFCCTMGGTNYLVTNTHVIEGALKFQFQTLNRVALVGVGLELANDRDLARIRLENAPPAALSTATGNPKHSATITVLGNSGGAGAVTKLEGKVQAVGPEVIEVDAPFVSGNSGSPILDEDNAVIGVATFVTKPSATVTNWVNEGTRFDKPRRFAVRLSNVQWVTVTPRQLYDQSSVLRDFDSFLEDSKLIMGWLKEQNYERLGDFSVQRSAQKGRYFDPQYPSLVTGFCNNLSAAAAKVRRGGLDPRSASVNASLRMAQSQFQQFPDLPLRKLGQTRWLTEHYRKQAGQYETVFTQWKTSQLAQPP